jgi:gluconolactonase
MARRLITFLAAALLFALAGCNEQIAQSLIASGAQVKQLATGFKFTEGPAADSSGNVYFTDIPQNKIHIYSPSGQVTTFLENSERANGLYFDPKGNLITCQGGGRKLVSIEAAGKITILADNYEGKKLNSPNDLWLTPNGGIYFTDPHYGRKKDDLQQDGEHVYYLPPNEKTIIRVTSDLTRPNGIIGTPNGKTLYIADHGAGTIYVYKINPDGTLTDKKHFAPEGSDGMTIDTKGNIYLTNEAVQIYNSKGEQIQTIEIPERPSNVTFAGKDKKTLFITARKSIYEIKMNAKGI